MDETPWRRRWIAEKEHNGLLFLGEKGVPCQRSSIERKWRRAQAKVGLSDDFRFHDFRQTGHTLQLEARRSRTPWLVPNSLRAGRADPPTLGPEVSEGGLRRLGRLRTGAPRGAREPIGHPTGAGGVERSR